MQKLADSMLDGGIFTGMPTELGYVLIVAFFAFVLLNFIMLVAGVTSWLERRVWDESSPASDRTAWARRAAFSGSPMASRTS